MGVTSARTRVPQLPHQNVQDKYLAHILTHNITVPLRYAKILKPAYTEGFNSSTCQRLKTAIWRFQFNDKLTQLNLNLM
jgi:hypothetical protein